MHDQQAPHATQGFPPRHGPVPAGGDMTGAPDLDCETAALFRATLRPLIDGATSWPALMDRLRAKGYGLAIRDGRLFLVDERTGARVCSLRYLGMPLRDLAARLGRPFVRALPGRRANGEILRAPPHREQHAEQ